MHTSDYLRILIEEIHSAVIATIGPDGHPQTRTIDMMLWDDQGVYFLTAKGKEFYTQLMEQGYIALYRVEKVNLPSVRLARRLGLRPGFVMEGARILFPEECAPATF